MRIPLSVEGIELALTRGGTPEARQVYLASLRERIARYERQYQVPSSLLLESLKENRLSESLDVVKWSFAYETLKRLEPSKA